MDYASGRALEATVVLEILLCYLKYFWLHPSNSNHRQFSETEKKSKYDKTKLKLEQNIQRNAKLIVIAFVFRCLCKIARGDN
jgi:hypothetical protein